MLNIHNGVAYVCGIKVMEGPQSVLEQTLLVHEELNFIEDPWDYIEIGEDEVLFCGFVIFKHYDHGMLVDAANAYMEYLREQDHTIRVPEHSK